MDIERGNVIRVGDGEGTGALSDSRKRVGSAKANIAATAISPGSIGAVKEYLPDATSSRSVWHYQEY